MAIMKFFTRRKSEILKKFTVGSALFLMSAFAAFSAGTVTPDKLTQDKGKETGDSIFNARNVFKNLNTSDLEILPRSTRLDMLDYWDVDSVYKASNVMEGLSWLVKVTDNYLKVQITPVSSLEIKILPGKKENFVMTVYTVGDDVQAEDSSLKFYNEQLSELDSSHFITMPQLKDFFEIPKGSITKMKEIEDMIPFPTIAFNADPENNNLKARLTVEQYVNQDDWNIAKLFVKPYITLEWSKDKYKLMKK